MIKVEETDPAVKAFRGASAKLRELQAEQSAALSRQIDDKSEALARMNQQTGHQGADAVTLAAEAMLVANMFLREVQEFFPAVFKELAGLTSKSPNGITVFKGDE